MCKILFCGLVMLISMVPASFGEEREEAKVEKMQANGWKKEKLKMIYSLHEDQTLKGFTVRYDGKLVCTYKIGKAGGHRYGNLLVEPEAGFSVNLNFADVGKDSKSRVMGLILKKKYAEKILTVVLVWDGAKSQFVEREYSYSKPDPDPFREGAIEHPRKPSPK